METLQTLPFTAAELNRRFSRACELKQGVNWGKIVECLQQWATVMRIDAAAMLRIESAEQYVRALRIGSDAVRACHELGENNPLASWAARATGQTATALKTKVVNDMISNAPGLSVARGIWMKSGMFSARVATSTRFRMDSAASIDVTWQSILATGAIDFGNGPEFSKWYPLFEAFEAGAYCFFFTDHCIEVATLPTVVRRDDRGLLHSESGPALVWLDEVRDFYWHGHRVSAYVVENPDRITVADIEAEPHAEVRKIKIKRMRQAHPNEEMPPIRSVTAHELKERYVRACELRQPVNWEKIVAYLRRWAAAFELDVPAIVRIEGIDQIKTSAAAAWTVRSAAHAVDWSARSESSGHDAWARGRHKLEAQAMLYRHSLSQNDDRVSSAQRAEWSALAEENEKLLVAENARTATSAARAASEYRNAKITSAAAAAATAWGANVSMTKRPGWHASLAWDVTLKCLIAINALEQDCQDTKFSTWYQLFKAFEAGAFCFFITDRCIEVCTIPSVVSLDQAGRLHSISGPAFVWLNDVRYFFWHGVKVEAYVVENPERITVADIEAEPNVEVRRAKIERFGLARYLIDSGAQEIHRDDFGILYRKQIPGDEPLVMIKVVNATPEPDGGFKDYFLRVPPATRTAREAVAWTFGKAPEDFDPLMES